MTPQKRWVVLIGLITIKFIKFQNFGKPGADWFNLLWLPLNAALSHIPPMG
jgi:hypothetical protein